MNTGVQPKKKKGGGEDKQLNPHGHYFCLMPQKSDSALLRFQIFL
jgi:hypothetical protein